VAGFEQTCANGVVCLVHHALIYKVGCSLAVYRILLLDQSPCEVYRRVWCLTLPNSLKEHVGRELVQDLQITKVSDHRCNSLEYFCHDICGYVLYVALDCMTEKAEGFIP
jgi:hypothetical protein